MFEKGDIITSKWHFNTIKFKILSVNFDTYSVVSLSDKSKGDLQKRYLNDNYIYNLKTILN